MKTRYAIFACASLLLACAGVPAMAEEQAPAGHGAYWWATRAAIYRENNTIALLEADPEADDGYKAPVIAAGRAHIRRLNASLPRAQWRWATPCCYSRWPIHIR